MKEVTFWQPIRRKRLWLSNSSYCLERSVEDGERDLERLVRKEEEGCWLFKDEDGVWLNLRTGIVEGKGNLGLDIVGLRLWDICTLESGARYSQYHTHPEINERLISGWFRDHYKELCTNLGRKPKISRDECAERLAAVHISIPSIGDIRLYSSWCDNNPGAIVDYSVASPYGIMGLRFTGEHSGAVQKYTDFFHLGKYERGAVSARNKDRKGAINSLVRDINRHMEDCFELEMRFWE